MVKVRDLNFASVSLGREDVVQRTDPLAQVGGLAAGVGQLLEQKERRDADAYNAKAQTELDMFGQEALEQATVEAESPEQISQIFFDKYKTKRNELLAGAPNDFAKIDLDETFQRMNSAYGKRAVANQAREVQAGRINDLTSSMDDIAGAVRNGMSDEQGLRMINEASQRSASFLSPSRERELREQGVYATKKARLDYLFEQGDLGEVGRLIADKKYNKELTADDIGAYRDALARQKRETAVDNDVIKYLEGKSDFVDPKSKEFRAGVDRVFQNNIEPALFSGDPVQQSIAMTQAMNLTNTTGVLPETMAGYVRAAYVGQEGASKDLAYQFIADLNKKNPAIVRTTTGLNDKQITEAVMYDTLKTDGVPEQDALNIVQASINPENPAVLSVRKEELKSGDAKPEIDIADMFDPGIFAFEPDILDVPGKQIAYEAKYRDLYESYYLMTGNKDVAQKRAEEVFRKNHGVSRITNDDEYVTDYPPESFYSHALFQTVDEDLNHVWMRGQLEEAISTELNKEVNYEQLRVVADGTTQEEVQRGIAPSYGIFIVTGDEEFPEYVGRFMWDQEKALEGRRLELRKKRRSINDGQGWFIDLMEKQEKYAPFR
ncbi:MAG: hypothetical protein MI745_14045 [Pseudomonadales bacterium]|nr:hypothetical protein [Pseudomonadales bacterium]